MSAVMRRYGVWLLIGAVLGLLLAVASVGMLTRTDWGRGQVLRYTLTALGGRLNEGAELEVDRLEGNVLTGARLYGVTLTDTESRPLLQADSAFIEYDLPTFLGGDVVISQFVLYDAEVLLVRLPGDSLWNYQAVLLDTTRTTGGAAARATLIERMRLLGARITVRLPFEPDDRLSPAARRREIRDALSDSSRLVVDSVPAGLVRTMRFVVDDATASEVYIAPDQRGGTYLRVDTAFGEAFLYDEPPIVIRHLQGDLALREGVMRYRAPTIVLPDSRLSSVGAVDLTGPEPAYDVALTAEQVAFSDMQWLNTGFPEEGGGQLRLWVETRPEGLLILARELNLRAPGTQLRGEFGMVFGDTLRFVEANLTASPLDVRTVERMLPTELPVEGLRIGSVEIRSDAS